MTNGGDIPLYAFRHKKNILYYFNEDKWQAMPFRKFEHWVSTLHMGLMAYFSDWYTENLSSISSLQAGAHWQEKVSMRLIIAG